MLFWNYKGLESLKMLKFRLLEEKIHIHVFKIHPK